ncbi:FtsB family cell division protein, partial [Nostocoides japonicum]|uniref:FtsB family cell division protein n=1 Tax=Nostocoides japonicum TaxID=99481 RepID=UPI0009F84D4E
AGTESVTGGRGRAGGGVGPGVGPGTGGSAGKARSSGSGRGDPGGRGSRNGQSGGKAGSTSTGASRERATRDGGPHAVNRTRRLAVLATVVALLAMFVGPTVHAYLGQRSQISQLREHVAAQERDVTSLQKQQQLWTDDQYVIQQARQRLKFVKVGEKSYTVIDGDADSSDTGLASAPASSDDHPWYGRLWESVGVADAPAAHP